MEAPKGKPKSSNITPIICAALSLATLAVYVRTVTYGFVLFDDPGAVYQNEMVKAGLTGKGFAWALTSFATDNWQPLTWLSLMLDCQLFGLLAGAMHLVNMAFHLASTLLLFLSFNRLTRQVWPSAFVAAVFALHPLHVESVAWIAERKDVLSTFFAMLALWFYIRHAEAPSFRRFLPVAGAFTLGLLAKPMLVTFPFVLLLLDFWPLNRLSGPVATWPLMREKLPLFALTVLSCLVTLLAHQDAVPLAALPFIERLGHAAIAYVDYLRKSAWPVDLAVYYPYQFFGLEQVCLDIALLAAVTLAVLRFAKRAPYLPVGWFWFLGMLVPVIGFVQAGDQALADRYMYMPLIGLSLMPVFGLAALVENRPVLRGGAGLVAVAALLALSLASYRQVGYWKNTHVLYDHALAVTGPNAVMRNNLGILFASEERHDEAAAQYRQALAIDPAYAEAHDNLGTLYGQAGRTAEAAAEFEAALKLNPADAGGENNLCVALNGLGRHEDALPHCQQALRLNPQLLKARVTLGKTYAVLGKNAEAAAEFKRVLAEAPDNAAAREELQGLEGK